MIRRVNKDKFQIVEDAIKLADQGKSEEAAKLCKAEGIPVDVTYRIIMRPSQRRSSFVRRINKEE
jgi:hypothetical protein